MATLLKVLNNLADIKSAGGVALRVRTQGCLLQGADGSLKGFRLLAILTGMDHRVEAGFVAAMSDRLIVDKKTKGAWLLAQSKNLDAVTGTGAARLENFSYAGRIGRLYNLLRRNLADDPNPTISSETVKRACQLNGIDKPTRDVGLNVLKNAGRIDVAKNGAVSVLGATTTAVLETTTDIFDEADPSNDEEAVLKFAAHCKCAAVA
jgi:hypothetical protein